jgi:broad-specificity NMP kinase
MTYFISGVNGVGKSSVMPFLRMLLPEGEFTVVDFDSRGVPDGADRTWRIAEANHWIDEGMTANVSGKQLIVCGFVKPQDFIDLPESVQKEIKIIVLDADEETVRTRLMGRYTKNGVFDENQKVIGKPVTDFIDGNVWYAKKMREESAEEGLPIIDTSKLNPEEVAKEIVRIIKTV